MESNTSLFMVKHHQLVKQWWMITKDKFKETIDGYDPKDIFNFDVTSLLFKLLPNHYLCLEAKTCGVKKLKDCFSVGVVCFFTWRKVGNPCHRTLCFTKVFQGIRFG